MAKPKATLTLVTLKKSRAQQARETCCPYHSSGEEIQAEDFCGAWINDSSNDGRGRECHKPLCRKHADIRLQLWVCPEHSPKHN